MNLKLFGQSVCPYVTDCFYKFIRYLHLVSSFQIASCTAEKVSMGEQCAKAQGLVSTCNRAKP
jgi:hypothetical protein